MSGSRLDRLIPPEIVGDPFYEVLADVSADPSVRHVLEIGASSGEGSTQALVAGALRQVAPPTIHCLEISEPRYEALRARWRDHPFVRCYHMSSVPVEAFASEAEVSAFRWTVRPWRRRKALDKALAWLRQDLEYVTAHGLSGEGIAEIQRRAGIEHFDAVLIDGSEFTGVAELERVYGAHYLMLDDVRTFKNRDNYRRLLADAGYDLIARRRRVRNGFAVFRRAEGAGPAESPT